MAISFTPAARPPISLETFVDEMRGHDTTTVEGVAACADLFAALNANERLLTDHITHVLAALRDRGADNEYTGQTFVLHREGRYFVRANVWLPADYGSMRAASQSDQFFYGVPHDHNFTFLTAGYFGRGYRTQIFEYGGTRRAYNVGDRAEATFLEETMLPQGKLILFRASTDIHTQYAPDEFSISLNLMTTNPHELSRTQQLFDDGCNYVVSQPVGDEQARRGVFVMAALLGDERTEELLHDLVASEDEGLRKAAEGGLAALRARFGRAVAVSSDRS